MTTEVDYGFLDEGLDASLDMEPTVNMTDETPAVLQEKTVSQEAEPRQEGGFSGEYNDNIPEEIYSKKIKGRSRIFFVDLKQSDYGKFLKISEKSRGGKKTTVIMDQEDIPFLIEALKDIEPLIKE